MAQKADQIETYGAKVHPNTPQVLYELYWFVRNGSTKLTKQQHFKNICVLAYPWVAKNWHYWYEMCLDAWCENDEIGMTGCANAHKTFMFTLLALTEWLGAPDRTRVVLSAPTVPALRGSVWARIKEAYDGFQASINARLPYNMVDSKTTLQFQKGNDEAAIIAVAVDSGSIEKAIGKIQGKHLERMIMIVDEAAQTEPAIFFARKNLRTATKFFRFVAIANASDQFDAHGQFCEPVDGWNSVTVESESWRTATGICLHFDGLSSPQVINPDIKYPKLFGPKDIETYRKENGENSREWWMYVRGFWPPTGLQDTILDAATINAGHARETAQWVGGFLKKAFLDPAFSAGGDRCILRFAKFGMIIDGKEGRNAMVLWDRIHIQLVEDGKTPINYQIANRVIKECQERGVSCSDFGMDVTSASGLADMIEQLWGGKIVRISFGGNATDKPMSPKDNRPAKKVCGDRVTELWYRVSLMVQEKLIREMDAGTAREFCMRHFTLAGERKYVESKSDMKKRTRGVSPDDADPVAGLADMYAAQFSGAGAMAESEADRWAEAAQRFHLVESYS